MHDFFLNYYFCTKIFHDVQTYVREGPGLQMKRPIWQMAFSFGIRSGRLRSGVFRLRSGAFRFRSGGRMRHPCRGWRLRYISFIEEKCKRLRESKYLDPGTQPQTVATQLRLDAEQLTSCTRTLCSPKNRTPTTQQQKHQQQFVQTHASSKKKKQQL